MRQSTHIRRLPGRVRSLTLIAPLGAPGRPTHQMAPQQRLVLPVARNAPAFGDWFLGRLAVPTRRPPRLFLRLAASGLSGIDRRALTQPGLREAFLVGYTEAFCRGGWEWPTTCGCSCGPRGSNSVPSWSRHRSTMATPIPRSRLSTPAWSPRRYRAGSSSCTRAKVTSPSSAPPGRCWQHEAAPRTAAARVRPCPARSPVTAATQAH